MADSPANIAPWLRTCFMEQGGKGRSLMTYASASGSFSGRTRAAASVSKPVLVFRTRKRNAVSTSCRPASHESHNLVEAEPEVLFMEGFPEIFVSYRPKIVPVAPPLPPNKQQAA